MNLLTYTRDALDKNTHELGFWPTASIVEAIDQGRVSVLRLNDEPAGVLIRGRGRGRIMRIHAAYTHANARRVGLQANELANLDAEATKLGCTTLQAVCAQDLDSNGFWDAENFLTVAVRRATTATRRPANVWQKPTTFAVTADRAYAAYVNSPQQIAWQQNMGIYEHLRNQFLQAKGTTK